MNELDINRIEEWTSLSTSEKCRRFAEIPRGDADDFFLDLPAREQAELILNISAAERRLWMRLLAPDDAVDLLQNVDEPEAAANLLAQLDEATRREVSALLAYREDVAGGRMSPRFARVRPDVTVDEAIRYLRAQARVVETIYYVYAIDTADHLVGVMSFRDLFNADGSVVVADMMRKKFVSVRDDADQEHVAKLFAESHLLAIPVLDADMHMKGIVTVDDVVTVVQQEASEDIQKMGGMEALDGPYLDIGFFVMVKKRAGWLAVLFLGEMLTATAMSYYEAEIAKAVVLALFLPLIISSGGNSGSQATTLVIRAMALGEVRLRDWFRVVRREIFSGLALGAILAMIGMSRILLWHWISGAYGVHFLLVGVTIALSLVGVVLFGTIAGSMLPFVLRRCGLDPASASAPFVATLVDVSGLVIYFTVASVVLSGTML